MPPVWKSSPVFTRIGQEKPDISVLSGFNGSPISILGEVLLRCLVLRHSGAGQGSAPMPQNAVNGPALKNLQAVKVLLGRLQFHWPDFEHNSPQPQISFTILSQF